MKKQSTTSGLAVLSIAGFICKILAFLYIPIQTAIVGDYGNGVISTGYRVYLFTYSLSTAGIPLAISKLVSEQNALGNYKGSKKIFRIAFIFLMVIGIAFSLILMLNARWATNQIKYPEAYFMLLTLAPVFIFTSINCALRGYFQGNSNMIPTSVSNVVEQFLNSVSTAILIYIFFSLEGNQSEKYANAAVGSAIGTIIGALGASGILIFIYFSTRKQINKREKLSNYNGPILTTKPVLLQLFKYMIPALIASIATSAADIIDAFICIPRMLAGGLPEVQAKILNGQFTTIFQRTSSITTIVAISLMIALIPAISHAHSLKDKKELRRKMNGSIKAIYIFMVPCTFAFTIFAKQITSFIFFNTEQKGYLFSTYWSWTNILIGIITIQTAILLGIGKPLVAPVNLIIGMIVKFFISYYLISIPAINIHGAAIGSAIGYLLTLLLNGYAIKNSLRIKIYYIRLAIKPILLSIVICSTYFIYILFESVLKNIIHNPLFVNDVSLALVILIAGFAYLVMIVKSKTLSVQELSDIPMGKKVITLLSKMRLL